jgi:hypothetical protein
MRRLIILLVACKGHETAPPPDVPHDMTSDTPGDGSTMYTGIACGTETDPPCSIPAEVCCDVSIGMDKCVAAGSCNERSLACDGPEDCPGQECCLFSDRSQCLDTGICGTTGVLSEVMCHGDGDCDMAAGEHCCGLSPGPVADVYGVCRAGGCPQ